MSNSHRSLVATIIIRIAVVVFVLAIAGSVFYALEQSKPKPPVNDSPPGAPRVLVMEATITPVRRQWLGYGIAAAVRTTNVPARVTTTVLRVPDNITEGIAINAGDLLAELDDSDFARQVEISTHNLRDVEAQLNRLEVEELAWQKRLDLANEAVELSRNEYDRFAKALKDGAANPREVDQARQALLASIRDQVAVQEEFEKIPQRRASLRAQQAAHDATSRLAKMNVERCRVTSPIAGVLQAVDIEPGENVNVGQRIARVVNLQRIEIPLRVTAGARAGIGLGDPVDLSTTGAFIRMWKSEIARIAPEDDESTRTMTAYVELKQEPDGANSILAPGTYVSGLVTSDAAEPRSIVPRRAVSEGQIRLVIDNTIVRRRIETEFQLTGDFPQFGLPDRIWIALREPIEAGALIVINGATAPPDGTIVDAVLPETGAFTAMDGKTGNNGGGRSETP